MAQFESFARVPGFSPRSVVDTAGQVRERTAKELEQMRQFFGSRRITDQQRIEDTRFVGQDLQALASLTESGTKYFEALAKQTAKDKEIGEQWDAWTKGIDDQTIIAEKEAEATAAVQNEAVSAARQGQDPLVVQRLEEQRKLGRGFQGQKASLIDGRNKYAAYMTNYVASNAPILWQGQYIPASELLAEGGAGYDQKLDAVIQQGRFDFIKNNGYQYATKTAFVEILAPTISSVENNIRLNKTTQSLAQYQKDEAARVDARTRDSVSRVTGPVSLADLQQVWNESTEDYRINNTGLSRRQANARAVGVLARAFVQNNVPGNLEKLKLVQQVPGQKGTELGTLYGPEIQAAIVEASRDEEQTDTVQANQLEQELYNKLSQEGLTPETRAAEIDKTVAALNGLNSRIGYLRARKLAGDSGTLVLDPNSNVNDARLEQQIVSGDLPDYETTINAGRAGRYSPEAIKKFEDAYSQKRKAGNPIVKETFDGYQESLDRQVEQRLGLKKDPQGKLNIVGRLLSYVDYPTAAALSTAINRDLVIQRDRILRNSLETDPEKLSAELDAKLSAWEKANLYTAGGKYYLNGFWLDDPRNATDKKIGPKKYKAFFDKFKDPKFRSAPSSLPKNLSSSYDPTMPISAEVALDYSPSRGDTLFDAVDLDDYKVSWENGVLDRGFINAADSVNMSPLDLINYELAAHQEAPYKPKVDTASISNPKQGAHAFELAGFPSRSAGYLSAAISALTDWSDPQSIELEQWAEQMRLENPRAYRLLMNPNSSDRHMQLAVNELLGPNVPNLSALAQYLTA